MGLCKVDARDWWTPSRHYLALQPESDDGRWERLFADPLVEHRQQVSGIDTADVVLSVRLDPLEIWPGLDVDQDPDGLGVGGKPNQIAWSPTSQRLAISFTEDSDDCADMIAIIATSIDVSNHVRYTPIGWIRGPQSPVSHMLNRCRCVSCQRERRRSYATIAGPCSCASALNSSTARCSALPGGMVKSHSIPCCSPMTANLCGRRHVPEYNRRTALQFCPLCVVLIRACRSVC